MGWGAIIAYAIIAISSVAVYYFTKPVDQAQGNDMAPNSIDAFNVTLAQEGTVVPVIFGIVRTNSNVLWWGNLVTVRLTETIKIKKAWGGSKKKKVTVGYRYYLALHHALGVGTVNIKGMWFDDKIMTIDAPPADPYDYTSTYIARVVSLADEVMGNTYIYQNPGCSTWYPTYGSKSNAMKPVSHVYMPKIWIGDNTSSAPTFHFLLDKHFPDSHPISFPRNATYGSGVASVIYEILLMAGFAASEIDETTFESAAQAFDFRNYYISIAITSQAEWRSHIKKIISNYVDATLRKNWTTGKYELIAHDVYINTEYGFTEQDFVEFSFTRPAWDDTFNDLRANYTDREQDYTRRTIRAYNSANIQLLGYSRQKTIDLTAFNDKTVASKRLWELLKRYSYPTAVIKFKTGLWGARAPGPGELIGIIHEEYGLSGRSYRILDKRLSQDDQNYIDWICEEDINNSFTLGYQEGGDPGWEAPDYGITPLVYEDTFEMPFEDSYTFICLAAKESSEVAFAINYSTDDVTYAELQSCVQWSMYGTLDELYDDETDEIDDHVGILFTPYNEINAPAFEDLSRTELYNLDRVVIIDNEMMGFQTMTPEGENSYRLTGVIRGAFNTPIQQHSASAPMWLTELDHGENGNIITTVPADFYLKYLPVGVGGGLVEIADASAIVVSGIGKGSKPYPPYRIVATRTGDEVVFTWLPVTRIADGAGTLSPADNSDSTNLYEGDFYFDADVGDHDQYVDGMTLTISQSGAFTVTIYNRVNNVHSSGAVVSVGSTDGEYVGPEITYT